MITVGDNNLREKLSGQSCGIGQFGIIVTPMVGQGQRPWVSALLAFFAVIKPNRYFVENKARPITAPTAYSLFELHMRNICTRW